MEAACVRACVRGRRVLFFFSAVAPALPLEWTYRGEERCLKLKTIKLVMLGGKGSARIDRGREQQAWWNEKNAKAKEWPCFSSRKHVDREERALRVRAHQSIKQSKVDLQIGRRRSRVGLWRHAHDERAGRERRQRRREHVPARRGVHAAARRHADGRHHRRR